MMARQKGHANKQEEECHSNESQGQESGSSFVSETQDAVPATADETPEDQPENRSGNCPSNESQELGSSSVSETPDAVVPATADETPEDQPETRSGNCPSNESQELGSSSVSEAPDAVGATADETREGQPETVGQLSQECNKGEVVWVDHTNSPSHLLKRKLPFDVQNNTLRPGNCPSNESQGDSGEDQELGSSSVSEIPDAVVPAAADEASEDQPENSTPTRKRKHSSGDEDSASPSKRNPTENSKPGNCPSNESQGITGEDQELGSSSVSETPDAVPATEDETREDQPKNSYTDSTTSSLPRQGNANIPRNPALNERTQRQEDHDVHQNQAGQENSRNNLVPIILENMPAFFIIENDEILIIPISDDMDVIFF